MKKVVLFLALFHGGIQAHQSVYEHISTHLLKNVSMPEQEQDCLEKDAKGSLTFHLPQLSDLDENSTLLQLLSAHESASCPDTQTSLLSLSSAHDLNLYFYDVSRPEYTLLSTLYRGQTRTIGKIALAHQLATPTDNHATLIKRQQLLLWFIKNRAKTTQLRELLAAFAPQEKMLLSLWNENDLLYTNTVKDQFYGGTFKKWSSHNGAVKLELKRRLSDAQLVLFPAAMMLYDWAVSRLTHHLDRQDFVQKEAIRMVQSGELSRTQNLSAAERKN